MYVGDYASSYRNNMFRDYEKQPYGTLEGNCQQSQQQRKSYYTLVQGKFCARILLVIDTLEFVKAVCVVLLSERERFRIETSFFCCLATHEYIHIGNTRFNEFLVEISVVFGILEVL